MNERPRAGWERTEERNREAMRRGAGLQPSYLPRLIYQLDCPPHDAPASAAYVPGKVDVRHPAGVLVASGEILAESPGPRCVCWRPTDPVHQLDCPAGRAR